MTEGLGGTGDFFGRIPLFREFARLMATASGPVNWELARQVAVATAAGAEDLGMLPQLPRPEAAPDPGEARSWDDRLRLAELWVDPVTSLPAPGVALAARPVNRPDWAEAVLGGFAPLVEPGARRVAEALGTGPGMGSPGVGDMVGRVGGLVAGLQVGTLVGQLARSVLGQYELAMPPADPAKVLLVPENVAEFERSADLPGDQLRLWLACHQVAGQRLLAGVPWLPEQLRRVVDDVALQTEPDAAGMMDRLQSMDMANPEALQELLAGGGEGLLGPPSAALQAATGRLEVLLALTAGYALVIAGRALEGPPPRPGRHRGRGRPPRRRPPVARPPVRPAAPGRPRPGGRDQGRALLPGGPWRHRHRRPRPGVGPPGEPAHRRGAGRSRPLAGAGRPDRGRGGRPGRGPARPPGGRRPGR